LRAFDAQKRPVTYVCRHLYQHGDDLIILLVERSTTITIEIAAVYRERKPRLGLGGFSFGISQLADESLRIPSFWPAFRKIATHGTR
jgi:hypothetical protein